MKAAALLPLLLLAGGCNMHDRMILYPPVPLEENSRKTRDTEFTIGTYRSMVEGLMLNAPKPNLQMLRSGTLTFVQGRTRTDFHFELTHNNPGDWSWLINDRKGGAMLYSLIRNHLGLTYQDLRGQVFLQGTSNHVWEQLQKMSWQSLLDETFIMFFHPTFNPDLDWSIEADGLKYLIITRVDQSSDEAVKLQYYIHKKSRTVQRIIKSTMAQNIVEEIQYANYNRVGEAYLPADITLTRSLGGEKIIVHINQSDLLPLKTKSSTLRSL